MGINDSFGCVRISRSRPKIRIRLSSTCDDTERTVLLYLRRVGDSEGEFAEYPPIDASGDYYTFQFDDLLFNRKGGRYKARLTVNGETCTELNLQYEASNCYVASVVSENGGCQSC